MPSGLRTILSRLRSRLLSPLLELEHDTLATVRLRPYLEPRGYVPATSFALRPSAIELIVNEILLSGIERPCVLELGSGYSTLCLERALRGRDGCLISVESDLDWLETTRRLLEADAELVRWVHAPLHPLTLGGRDRIWYELEPILAGLGGKKIDFLVVDGPFGGTCAMARWPAYPLLVEHLAERCVTFLDDIGRPDERRIAREWCAAHSLTLETHPIRGGIGILRRGQRPARIL